MTRLLIAGGRVVDPLNNLDGIADVLIEDGRIERVAAGIDAAGAEVLDARGKVVMPGVIDMHAHLRTVLGHPHAQRMVALAGVTTVLDMAGPLENILESIPTSGSGINMAILEAARAGMTLSSPRPDAAERRAFIEKTLKAGGIGIKLLGGHFPMDLDISAGFIEAAAQARAWVGWHVGNTVHGSDIEGMRDAVDAADGKFLHIAHINSYCRGKVRPVVDEALEAIELLKSHPQIFSESYLSPLNGTRLTIENGVPATEVTKTCLRRLGYEATAAGLEAAIFEGRAGVLADDGRIGRLIYGPEAVRYWKERKTITVGSFAVNPVESRFLLATAKREDKSFVVDAFSTDGGSYPRNVIVENGMLLVLFGALTLSEFVAKASLAGARALGLPAKGHLSAGADGDVTVIDVENRKAAATIVAGKVIMKDGVLMGHGTTIICDERGAKALQKRGIAHVVKKPLAPESFRQRFVCQP